MEIADWLSDRYPEEMTIVMQNWFEGLEVGEEGFSVTLNFGDAPEPLYIPYEAIRTFVDPSVEFGLRFEATRRGRRGGDPGPAGGPCRARSPPSRGDDASDDAPAQGARRAEVVSLDKFPQVAPSHHAVRAAIAPARAAA